MKQRNRPQRELSPYQKKLLDPRWQKMRLAILQRDEWRCRMCGDDRSTLHVHHRYYVNNTDPWEYPLEALLTLCAECHEDETNSRSDMEAGLLYNLKVAGTFSEDIRKLAVAFMRLKPEHFQCDIFGVIAWAIEHEDVMLQLIEHYLEYYPHKRQLLRIHP